jgi:uncharacterized protein with GYD domain
MGIASLDCEHETRRDPPSRKTPKSACFRLRSSLQDGSATASALFLRLLADVPSSRASMNTYFILLSKSDHIDESALALDEDRCADLVRITGVRSLDVYLATGEFEMVLICEAPHNGPIRLLHRELRGWIISSILASHVGCFGMTAEARRRDWLDPRQKAGATQRVDEG